MKNREKRRKILKGALIILALIISYYLGRNNFNLFPNLNAQEEPNMERATSSKHGYGMYLSFEYEIVQNYPYGTFVVVKQTSGNNSGNLTVAGL